jgi:O-antigen ligase
MLGLAIRWVIDLWLNRITFGGVMGNPIVFFVLIYVVIAVLSLSSLPLASVFLELGSFSYFGSLQLIQAGEDAVYYPILNVAFQLQLLFLFLMLVNYAEHWGRWYRIFILAVFSGVVLSVLAGVLDYYGATDLRFLRPLDPNVNPGDKQFRLQSFFGHSGWYAQYLTLAIPSILVLLTFGASRKLLIVAIVIGLIIVEYVLILTFQRGGWISYPFTVLVIWFSIYVLTHPLEGIHFFQNLKKSAIKILISVPITIVLSLTFISVLNQTETTSKYVERAEAIANAQDRTRYFPVSLNLASIHPIFGGGSESFAYRFKEQYLDPQGQFRQERNYIGSYYGSAHNVYLQTLTGKGYVGLLSLLLLLGVMVAYVGVYFKRGFVDSASGNPISVEQRIILMIGLCFTAAFAIYGNVQEIFYIPGLNVLLFLFFGVVAAKVPAPFVITAGFRRATYAFVGIAAFAHLYWEYVDPGYSAARNRQIAVSTSADRHCYGIEMRGEERWQWCRRNARIAIPVAPEQTVVEFVLVAGNPDLADRPLTVHYGPLSGPQEKVVLTEQARGVLIRIPVTESSVITAQGSDSQADRQTDRVMVISVNPSRTWIPKNMGVNDDTRELGVSINFR